MNGKNIARILIAIVVLVLCSYIVLWWEGILFISKPTEKKYSVKGIDVSHYQGDIPWKQLRKDLGIKFVFIKATEGSSHVDEKFEENWKEAQNSGLYVGAYHFFSFDSEGRTQAKNFIKYVKPKKNMLPPVVDVEYYDDKASNNPKKQDVCKELDVFLYMLEREYGCKPIVYTTMSVYEKYINEYYNAYPLWIRNTYYRPFIVKNRQWAFWQYSENGKWPYSEANVDMNVFAGSYSSFLRYFNLEDIEENED